MSGHPYMKLWVADFVGDTMHLSAEEIGQYMLLLMAMWRNGGTLSNDNKSLERIARSSISPNVLKMFITKDGMLTQKRLDAELSKAKAKTEAARVSAKARWLKNNDTIDANALRTQSQRNANHSQLVSNDTNKPSPLAILKTVLDEETAKAVIEHRKKKRSPLTTRAAKLLASNLSRCPDANKAADTMILRGWQSIEPGWGEASNKNNGWRQNGDGGYARAGSPEFAAWWEEYKRQNSPRQWDFSAAEKSGGEVRVDRRWPGRSA